MTCPFRVLYMTGAVVVGRWIGREQIHRVQWHPQLRSRGEATGVFGARAVQDPRPGRDLLAHRRILAAVQGNSAQHVEGGGDAWG